MIVHRPDGVTVVLPETLAWALKHEQQPATIRGLTDEAREVHRRKGGTRRERISVDVPDPNWSPHPLRVVMDGWAYWLENGEIQCERLRA
jgi:hypothetical protein